MSSIILNDKLDYNNIEIGAGCGNFGTVYYPKCYLTDNDTTLVTTCTNCMIDHFCSAYELPWKDNRFDKIILCNPYGFGFHDEENANLLLNELIRVSKDGSEIILICNNSNRFCAPDRVKKRSGTFTRPNTSLSLADEDINSSIEYSGYIFRSANGLETKPNKRIKINVGK